jgi:hypothetical protein
MTSRLGSGEAKSKFTSIFQLQDELGPSLANQHRGGRLRHVYDVADVDLREVDAVEDWRELSNQPNALHVWTDLVKGVRLPVRSSEQHIRHHVLVSRLGDELGDRVVDRLRPLLSDQQRGRRIGQLQDLSDVEHGYIHAVENGRQFFREPHANHLRMS